MPGSAVDQHLEQQHLAFTLALHRAVATDPTTTACWSPFSVASALGLTATGARGATREELAAVLAGTDTLADQAALLAQAAQLTGAGDAVLGVSNTLWAREDIPVHPEFAEELLGGSAWPGGAIRDAPFRTDSEGARRLINADVADTTRGLIPALVPAGTFGPDTVATLVNALYLKVGWLNRFPDGGTEPRPFHAADGEREVPTMRLRKRLGYARKNGWQAVFLPAAGGVEAVVLLPDAPLADAEPALETPALTSLLTAARGTRLVELYLPRFRVTSRARLAPALNDLGVRTLFTADADLSGISSEPLRVSDVLHQAVLTIDEQGLEGAAATAVAMRAMAMVSSPEQPIVVRVDRPFLFLVRHKSSGALYFMARVVRP
ncbi:MAG TPA: serpin family protein [Pseudonocardiaceae bacterium]|nr:serpin family protein [Pseudonocardiaceae bacterium]